jgi:hypothetical protein
MSANGEQVFDDRGGVIGRFRDMYIEPLTLGADAARLLQVGIALGTVMRAEVAGADLYDDVTPVQVAAQAASAYEGLLARAVGMRPDDPAMNWIGTESAALAAEFLAAQEEPPEEPEEAQEDRQ